jgi:hypothetical protein
MFKNCGPNLGLVWCPISHAPRHVEKHLQLKITVMSAADTGLASVGHGAISRRDRYRAETVCGRASHATGSMRTRHISTCSIL